MKNKSWPQYVLFVAVLSTALFSMQSQAQQVMSLQEAEKHALKRDAKIMALHKNEQALREDAIADQTLPDPQIKLGMLNFPTDTFLRTQEPMTQIQVGIQQKIPRGDSLGLKSTRTNLLADIQGKNIEGRKRDVLYRLRKIWFEVYYWHQAEKVVGINKNIFKQLVNISQTHYASGRSNQQDVTQAQFELGKLDDRLLRIKDMQEKNRAMLFKWIGDKYSNRSLSTSWPHMQDVPALMDIKESLYTHPVLLVEDAKVDVAETSMALARESYKPELMLDISYGFRDGFNANGTERSDFASAMIKMDVPLFTGKRQDKRVAASQQRVFAAKDMKQEKLRELQQMLDQTYASWSRLSQRLEHFRRVLLPIAKENMQAAQNAYQSDTTSFATLMRSQSNELETELQSLRLQVDFAKTQAGLFYLAGEK